MRALRREPGKHRPEMTWEDEHVASKKRRKEAIVSVSASARAQKAPKRSGKTRKNGAGKTRHNAAFVVGSVIGGLAGAAAALWKTPYSGDELRSKLTGGGQATNGSRVEGDAIVATPEHREHGQSFRDKILSTVENRLAPIVGVQLGKTANDAGAVRTAGADARIEDATPRESSGLEPTTSMGPGAGVRPGTETGPAASSSDDGRGASPAYPDDEPVSYRDDDATTGAGENVTPVDRDGGAPSRMSSPVTPASEDDAASVEELTKPQVELVPEAFREQEGHMKPFPKLGGIDRT